MLKGSKARGINEKSFARVAERRYLVDAFHVVAARPKRIGQAEYLSDVLYVRSPRWNSGPGGKRVVK
ncbi:hypothetical protein K0M31_002181, partial [Melipona bicolor]